MSPPSWVRTGVGAGRLTAVVVILLVCWATCFLELGQSSLWHSQEGRVARIARHMVRSGKWLLPEFEEGKVAGGKPVLYHWLVALVGVCRGFDEATIRAPSAVASLLTVLVVYVWVSGFTGRWAALGSALVLTTSVRFVALGRMARVDMLLTLWVTLSYLCFYLGYQRPGERRRWFLLMYVALALAMMTKGPVGVALPVVGMLAFLVVRWELRLLKELELLRGALIFLVIAAPWYVAAGWLTRGEFLVKFFGSQNLSRFLGIQVADFPARGGAPWWFYGPHLALAVLPWTSLAVCALLWQLWPGRREVGSTEVADVHPARTLACCWFLAGLVLLSLSRGKRPDYVLPLLPGLALLIGGFWESAYGRGRETSGRLGRATGVLQALLLAVAAVFVLSVAVLSPLSDWWRRILEGLLFRRDPALFRVVVDAFGRHLIASILVFVGAVVTAWVWFGSRSSKRARSAMVLTVAVALTAQLLHRRAVVPVLDQRHGWRSVAAEIAELIPPDQPLILHTVPPHGLLFYLDRPTETLPAENVGSLAAVAAQQKTFHCLTSAEMLQRLPSHLRENLHVLYQSPATGQPRYVLITSNGSVGVRNALDRVGGRR